MMYESLVQFSVPIQTLIFGKLQFKKWMVGIFVCMQILKGFGHMPYGDMTPKNCHELINLRIRGSCEFFCPYVMFYDSVKTQI